MINLKTYRYKKSQIDYIFTEYDDFLVHPKKTGKVINLSGEINDLRIGFQKLCSEEKLSFLITEVSPSDKEKKNLLRNLDFYYCNTTCKVYNKNISQIKFTLNSIIVEKADKNVKHKVKDIMTSKFGWGRIYEDCRLYERAEERMEKIIDSYINNPNVTFLISRDVDKLIGYYIYTWRSI